jgi:hypothetical protein
MENMEQPEITNDLDNFFHLSFDAIGREHLKQVASWAKIASIAAIASYAVHLFLVLFGHSRFASFGDVWSTLLNVTIVGGGATVNYFLYRFAVAAGRGVQSMDALHVNSGFNSLRLYFKSAGILAIITICLILIYIFNIFMVVFRQAY